jgi:uncharacterized protein YjiS (DUF1127 family)
MSAATSDPDLVLRRLGRFGGAALRRLAALPVALVRAPVRALVRAPVRAWRRCLAEEHLMELDDKLLRDIGLDRQGIREGVRRGTGRWRR